MRRFKWILPIAASALLLVGCTKADQKPDGVNGNEGTEGSASFRVTSLSGDGTVLQVPATTTDVTTNLTYASIWKVPREASFRFTACIDDRATRKAAIGHQFAVEIPGSRQRIADVPPTTGEGCFSWHESVPFTYFVKRSKWVTLERDIIGIGLHSGRHRVKVAVNPWAVGQGARDSGDEFRFLRDKPLHPSLLIPAVNADAALSGEALGQDQLYVGDVDIQTIRMGEESSGTLIRLNISMTPKIRFESQEGVPSFKSVKSGDFYVIAHLVLSNTGPKLNERVILTSPGESSELQTKHQDLGVVGTGRVIDGKLVAHVSTWVRGRMPQGNLELVLKVIPKGIRGLSAAEGIYELGTFRNLSSKFSGELSKNCREDGPCDMAAYLKAATNFEEMRQRNYGADNSPYLFDRMHLRFAQVEPGETTTQRTVTYSASTCITDAFTGERPVGLPFIITYKETGEVISDRKTEEDGCLRWSSSIFHKYYQPEQFIPRTVVISKSSGFSRPMRFYINPWDDKFTFGFDEREFRPEFWKGLLERKKIPSRFFLAAFGYHTVRFQYNIDSLMALEVRKTVLMELDPRVLRYSGIINARKMTEPLRDGIWLMKVGIQKNYLDPAQAGIHIDAVKDAQSEIDFNKPPEKSEKYIRTVGENGAANTEDPKRARQRLRKLGIDVPQREFISTQRALVRSTDGVIIQPVEFTMQDLRMMRVRSNFLIELQPVDERQLQVENVLRGNFSKYLDGLEKQRKERNSLLGKHKVEDFDQQKIWDQEDQRTNKVIDERRNQTRILFDQLSSQLRTSNSSGVSLEPFSLSSEQLEYFNRMSDGAFESVSIKERLENNLSTNDFTTIKLPPCTEIDCDRFVEMGENPDDVGPKGPGLARRTFVGPVIFLSNAYKDSVRATDNLDEAKCGSRVQFDDERERELDEFRRKLFSEADDKISKVRENTLYKFSEYFGSLRHLCKTHVDDLIEREEKYKFIYETNAPAVGSIYNYAQAFSMNILSLADEKPKAVDFSAESFERCGFDLTKCMLETTDFWVPVNKALGWINTNLSHAGGVLSAVKSWITGTRDVKNSPWTVDDLRQSLFKSRNEDSRRFAACALVSANMAESLKSNGARVMIFDALTFIPVAKLYSRLQTEIMESCLKNHVSPIYFDEKLRVFKTGEADDSYVFLGGYQMNINVGQSFSVGRSDGYSWSAGVEGTDFVGTAGGVAGGLGRLGVAGMTTASNAISPISNLLKPFSIKAGVSTSLASSDGTSISESTYLVAQIAKFRVRLDEYERCLVLNFSKEFMRTLELQGVISYNPRLYGNVRSLFVCEGVRHSKPRYIDEMYFYFTQHFTEGDMLDQADLYNHPWLLALRGFRDFGSFISLIRKQESISFWETTKNIFTTKQRSVDWPLAHLRDTYKKIVPSFPGFYTVLNSSEGLTEFPLEMTKDDPDMNFEVKSRDRRLEQQRRGN